MNQDERRNFLIKYLQKENPRYENAVIPDDKAEQKRLLRALVNVRPPKEIGKDFIKVQDEYLTQALREKGVVRLSEATDFGGGLYLWQGDITRLSVDAIVNAANSGMTGCYAPNHTCIDNCIHTFSGIQLRQDCGKIMAEQGYEEPTGRAKITPGYNLPCKYVIHTVGPIVSGNLKAEDEKMLESCYNSCLTAAKMYGCESIAFCCISTGLFCFPNKRAAEIAVETVKKYKQSSNSKIKVVFNVFKDNDKSIYEQLLGAD